jgi:hypothetical protein
LPSANPLGTKARCRTCDRARSSRHIHRHDIRARRGLDHGRRVFAFADVTEDRLLAVEARNTCRHRSWAPKAGRTLGGATLTFSDAAGLGREPYRLQDRDHMREVRGNSAELSREQMTWSSHIKIVELRGLEPLTFSLRRHRVHLVLRKHCVIDVHAAVAGAPWLHRGGTHGAHGEGLPHGDRHPTHAVARHPMIPEAVPGGRIVQPTLDNAAIGSRCDLDRHHSERCQTPDRRTDYSVQGRADQSQQPTSVRIVMDADGRRALSAACECVSQCDDDDMPGVDSLLPG